MTRRPVCGLLLDSMPNSLALVLHGYEDSLRDVTRESPPWNEDSPELGARFR